MLYVDVKIFVLNLCSLGNVKLNLRIAEGSGFDFLKIVNNERIEDKHKQERNHSLHDSTSQNEHLSVELEGTNALHYMTRIGMNLAHRIVAFA